MSDLYDDDAITGGVMGGNVPEAGSGIVAPGGEVLPSQQGAAAGDATKTPSETPDPYQKDVAFGGDASNYHATDKPAGSDFDPVPVADDADGSEDGVWAANAPASPAPGHHDEPYRADFPANPYDKAPRWDVIDSDATGSRHAEPTEPHVYMPKPAANAPVGTVSRKKPNPMAWAAGGLAIGAIVAGLGTFAVMSSRGSDATIPDHTTTQWDGTSEEKKGSDGSEKGGKTAKSEKGVVSSRGADESTTLARDVASQCLPSVVAVHVADGLGSGVIIDDDGHVITNSHVVKDQSEIVVVLGSGEEFTAEVLGLDDTSDLAVLDVDWGDAEIVPMSYGDSSELMVGDWVMTIGSPYGLDQSVSTGIVSALSRNQLMESYGGYRIYANLIQTDAAINLGNSGGALVNSDGELVGINSMLASSSGSYSAVGFAIPSNYAKKVADQIIAGDEVEHAYIGAQFGNVSMVAASRNQGHGTIIDESGNEVDQTGGAPKTGAYVAGVLDDSPAKEAGLQEGDIIVKFGDEKITSASSVILAVRAHDIGETVPVVVWRDGKEVTIEVTLGSDKGKGLYDNDGSNTRGQQQDPYQQYDPYGGVDPFEYLERMLEQMGIN